MVASSPALCRSSGVRCSQYRHMTSPRLALPETDDIVECRRRRDSEAMLTGFRVRCAHTVMQSEAP